MQEEFGLSKHYPAIILQGITDGIIAQDMTGRVLYTNDATARLLGYPDAQALAVVLPQPPLPAVEILDELGIPCPLSQLPDRSTSRGIPHAPFFLRFRYCESGTERWAMVKTQAVWNEREQMTLVVSTLQDITALKRTEQAQHILAEASRLYSPFHSTTRAG